MRPSQRAASGVEPSTNEPEAVTDCPDCSGRLVTEGGERSCTECGLIVDEYRIDHGPEWRSFGRAQGETARTGAPLTPARHDRGLSTEIGYGVDANGNPLSPRNRRRLGRLRREHQRGRMRGKAERNLAHAFGEIARLAGALELPTSIRDEACSLYRQAQRENLILGRSIEAMAAGAVYAACRCRGVARTVDEVATVAGGDREAVLVGYRALNVELGVAAVPPGPAAVVSRLATAFGVSDTVRRRANELATLAESTGIANGRNPSGVGAACVYVAGREHGESLTQAALAEVAGVTPTTIRQRYRELVAATG